MEYRWRNLTFNAIAGRDDSTVLLVDPVQPPGWNLSVRCEELPGGQSTFENHVKGTQPAPGATVESTEKRKVAGGPATVFTYALKLPDGSVLRQWQALVSHQSQVFAVTMTAVPAKAQTALAAFEKLLKSIKWVE